MYHSIPRIKITLETYDRETGKLRSIPVDTRGLSTAGSDLVCDAAEQLFAAERAVAAAKEQLILVVMEKARLE